MMTESNSLARSLLVAICHHLSQKLKNVAGGARQAEVERIAADEAPGRTWCLPWVSEMKTTRQQPAGTGGSAAAVQQAGSPSRKRVCHEVLISYRCIFEHIQWRWALNDRLALGLARPCHRAGSGRRTRSAPGRRVCRVARRASTSCHGTWARVNIDQFRHLALQTC
jgi:hypothetical protein